MVVSDTLQNNPEVLKIYANIKTVLEISLVTAATSAGVERANSSLRFVKNVYRSVMKEDRFNALIVLLVHRNIALDYGKVIDMYSQRYPRHMLFCNALSSE